MSAVDTIDTGRAALLAAGLSGLNPKNLALTLAAATNDAAIMLVVLLVLGAKLLGSGLAAL